MNKITDFKFITLTGSTENDKELTHLFNDGYRIARELQASSFITLILVKETVIEEQSESTDVVEGEVLPDLGVEVEETVDTNDKFGQ